jgi:hypothetical protein
LTRREVPVNEGEMREKLRKCSGGAGRGSGVSEIVPQVE